MPHTFGDFFLHLLIGWSTFKHKDMDKNNDDDNKIIEFPTPKEREEREDTLRKLYREEQKHQKKVQKVPFMNWDKIPLFTRAMLGVLIAIHVIITFGLNDTQTLWLIESFGFTPALYSGAIPWSWSAVIAPITSLFIHGSWMHLIFNIVMMMAMGVFCERQFGAKITLIIFLLCGIAGNLVYFALSPNLIIPVIGASGAISGLFAVAFMFMIESGQMGPQIQRRGPLPLILLWSTIIIGVGFISTDTAWQSHLGGFFSGITLVQLQKKGIIKLFW